LCPFSFIYYFVVAIIGKRKGDYAMSILEKVTKLFAQKVKVEKIEPTTELRELGLDSLDLVELMMDLEKEFSIEFENDEMTSFKTLGDVVKAIEAKK
jgi:acyl carrier protein